MIVKSSHDSCYTKIPKEVLPLDAITTKKQLKLARWAAIVQDFQNSSLKLKDWLALNNLSKDQFYYWRKKVEEACLTQAITTLVEIPVNETKQLPVITTQKEVIPSAGVNSEVSATLRVNDISIDIYNSASKELLTLLMEVVVHAK